MVHTTIFDCIAVTENLIGCDSFIDCKSFADYTYFIIQKVADKVMIDLNTEEFAICMNGIEELAI